MTLSHSSLSATLLALLAFVPQAAHAQWRRATESVGTTFSPWVHSPNASSTTSNPASLPLLRDYELSALYLGSFDGSSTGPRGEYFAAALPLLFDIGVGISVEHIRSFPSDRVMTTLALGYALDRSLSIGANARFLASSDPSLAGLFSVDLSASFRPTPLLAFSAAVRDVGAPGYRLPILRDGEYSSRVDRGYSLGFGLRPLRTNALGFDFTFAADESGRAGLRTGFEIAASSWPRLFAYWESESLGRAGEAHRAVLGLGFSEGTFSAEGAAILSENMQEGPGFGAAIHVHGDSRTGVFSNGLLLDLDLRGLSERGLIDVLARLERARLDSRVEGAVLRFAGSGVGLSAAQELRTAIAALRAANKPILCSLADATGAELYACAGASRIVLDPAGGVRLYGPSSEVQHYAELLQNLGIRADFVRIGAYKSAIEAFQNNSMSEAAREARTDFLQHARARLEHDFASDRNRSETEIAAAIDHGPLLSHEAQSRGLVDRIDGETGLDEEAQSLFGEGRHTATRLNYEPGRYWARPDHIGVVLVDGDITDGDNTDIPLLEIHTSGGRTISRTIDAMAADPAVSAIVLRIDSPGGSVLASDQIWRAVRRARRRKPVLASMGSVAASGGYYIASACDEIWANPQTMTGSIGVWFGKVDFQPLAERYGVHTEEIRAGAHAGAESLWRPFDDSERARLTEMVRHWYRTFLQRISEGRGMAATEIDRVARGRVWSGEEALEHQLIDRLGSFTEALNRARELAGLGEEAPFVMRPVRPESLLDYVTQGIFPRGSASVDIATSETSDGSPNASTPNELGAVASTLAPEWLQALRVAFLLQSQVSQGHGRSAMPMVWSPELRSVH